MLSDDSVIINCKDDGSDDDEIKDNDDGTFGNLNNVNQGKSGRSLSCLWSSTINCGGIAPWQMMMMMMIMRMMMVKSSLMMTIIRTPMKTLTAVKRSCCLFAWSNF